MGIPTTYLHSPRGRIIARNNVVTSIGGSSSNIRISSNRRIKKIVFDPYTYV